MSDRFSWVDPIGKYVLRVGLSVTSQVQVRPLLDVERRESLVLTYWQNPQLSHWSRVQFQSSRTTESDRKRQRKRRYFKSDLWGQPRSLGEDGGPGAVRQLVSRGGVWPDVLCVMVKPPQGATGAKPRIRNHGVLQQRCTLGQPASLVPRQWRIQGWGYFYMLALGTCRRHGRRLACTFTACNQAFFYQAFFSINSGLQEALTISADQQLFLLWLLPAFSCVCTSCWWHPAASHLMTLICSHPIHVTSSQDLPN